MNGHFSNTDSRKESRFEKGWRQFQTLDPEAPQRLTSMLARFAPDMAQYMIEFAYGDIYARQGLQAKQRQLVIISALTVLGDSESQLELHICAARNVGLIEVEIVETIMQCAPFCGMPRTFNALMTAKRVCETLTDKDLNTRGES